jgi:hypothetical protein
MVIFEVARPVQLRELNIRHEPATYCSQFYALSVGIAISSGRPDCFDAGVFECYMSTTKLLFRSCESRASAVISRPSTEK